MSYAQVGEEVRSFVERMVELGVPRELVVKQMRPVEISAVQAIADSQKDQLLLDLAYKTVDLAKRFDVDERTIRNWRQSAIDRKYCSGTGSANVA